MRVEAKEQIKFLLMMRNMTITELAQIMTQKTGKSYTLASISGKFQRGTLNYSEILTICEILKFKIEFKDIEEE